MIRVKGTTWYLSSNKGFVISEPVAVGARRSNSTRTRARQTARALRNVSIRAADHVCGERHRNTVAFYQQQGTGSGASF